MAKKRAVVLRPLFTEKMSELSDTERKYAFAVRDTANKMEIKRAVQNKFDVQVTKVATMNMRGKMKTMTVRSGGHVIRTFGQRNHWKKAIVTLAEGHAIDLYQGEGVTI